MNITIPLIALIGQFLLIAGVFFAFSNKFMNRISKIESRIDASDKANEVLRNDFNASVAFAKDEFVKNSSANDKMINKLDGIKEGIQDVKLDVVDIKSQLKYKNGNKI
jgi:hypothetical protein